MRIFLTRHAKMRMEERNVDFSEVRSAIARPLRQRRKGGKTVVMKIRANGHLLVIYYVLEGTLARVITVITTSKLSKYLKDV